MQRLALTYLENSWLAHSDRKPLVIRGARQVGKTWLVRALTEKSGKNKFELNFERNSQSKTLFESNDPKVIIQNLEVYFNQTIDPLTSILFLDEIQEAPEILAKLRWFYEELPELPVIAAGSLLEFILQEHSFSMPVGRITYLHLEPLSFEEFLEAKYGNNAAPSFKMMSELDCSSFDNIPLAIHNNLQTLFRDYMQVGGMPASVLGYIRHGLNESISIQEDLVATYRDDFYKYKGRLDVHKLDTLLRSVPAQLGEKFVYAKADVSIQAITAKQILSLFNKARICHKVQHSSGNKVPLIAEVKDKVFKQIFLDVGLSNRMLGNLSTDIFVDGIAEQMVGQMLRCLFPFNVEPALYYWTREEQWSNAEVDYLIEHKNYIIPIEVKSGSTGSLKSLHMFMALKKLPLAIRINNDLPSITHVKTKIYDGKEVSYTLLSIPFYLTGQIHRLIDSALDKRYIDYKF